MAKDSDFPSLPAMLQAAIDNRDALAPHATERELAEMSEQLGQQERALDSLIRVKDQHIAQLGGNPFDDATLRKGDVENFVKSVQQLFNRLYTAHDDERYIWSPQAQRSAMTTTQLLEFLETEMNASQRERGSG